GWAIPQSGWLLGERRPRWKLARRLLGMTALARLLAGEVASVASLLILAPALSWAPGSLLQKRYPMSMPAGPYTAWIMLLGGVPIFIGALLFDDFGTLRHVRPEAALGIAYNVLIAFAWAHWAWIKLATAVSVTVFSLSMLVIPVVGVLSGMLFLGER